MTINLTDLAHHIAHKAGLTSLIASASTAGVMTFNGSEILVQSPEALVVWAATSFASWAAGHWHLNVSNGASSSE